MKIVVLTQDAPVYLAAFLDDFLTRIAQSPHHIEIISIVLFPPYFKKSLLAEVKERYDYYGLSAFIRMSLFILQNKLLAKFSNDYSVNGVLKKHQISRHEVDNINGQAFRDYLNEHQVDLLVSIACPKILKRFLLDTPTLGVINYHTALLPKYRGRQPLFRVLLNDESETGITIHEMDEKLDNGAIIVQERIPITPNDSLHSLYLKTTAIGPRVLVQAIEHLAAGNPERLPNDSSQATYFSFPTADEARQFRAKGKRFF